MDKQLLIKKLNWVGSLFTVVFMLLTYSQTVTGQDKIDKSLLTLGKTGLLYEGMNTHQDISRSVVLNKIISLDIKKASLLEALKIITDKINLELVYDSKLIEKIDRKITVTYNQVSVEKALWEVLKGTGLRFAVSSEKNLILIKINELKQLQKPILELVSGLVTDASTGDPLPGVNVVIKGTTTGTSTNSQGEYELNVPSLQDTLVFSFIGYQAQEVPINGRNEIDVKLQFQAVAADELVVIGYGTQRKSDITGSVSSVTEADFNKGVNVSTDQLMQGRVAGALVSQTTGEPGGGFSVNIRGAGSANAGNQPLYVIDGLPVDNTPLLPRGGPSANPRNPLNAINPNDIASIEILKDASATAIYGASVMSILKRRVKSL